MNRPENGLCMVVGLLAVVASAGDAVASCTIGVADGTVTSDGRALVWKSAMVTQFWDDPFPLQHVTGGTYDYICFDAGASGRAFEGVNSAGLATANSWAGPGLWEHNAGFMGHCLENFASVDEVRVNIYWRLGLGTLNKVTGCYSFIDASGNATMFEINNNNWVYEYFTQNPDRAAQNLGGRVVRANEFHAHHDGTDDTMILGRYYTGNSTTTNLIAAAHDLCARTVVQSHLGPNSGFEILRYGPNRQLDTIANDLVVYSMAVQGVAPGENPKLATMWTMTGQANYTIAVPMWVAVSDLPDCLTSGTMADRAWSLHAKGNEETVFHSVQPLEAHLFEEVEQLLAFWRSTGGMMRAGTMEWVEHRMAEDAYSLLDCLDNLDDNNLAPTVVLAASGNTNLTVDFTCRAIDTDGLISRYEWNFGDDRTSDQRFPSHTYGDPGWRLVSCTVFDDDGVSNTDWEYVYVVPEPATLALVALGGLGALLSRKRR